MLPGPSKVAPLTLPSGPDKTLLGEALRALLYLYIARDLFYGSSH